jgi:hypothetical protein
MTTTTPSGSATSTATVETLAAEVRVLMVGNRQVTLSVAKQLDWVPLVDLELFGRVKLGADSYAIGKAPDGTLALAKYRHTCYGETKGWRFDATRVLKSVPADEVPHIGWEVGLHDHSRNPLDSHEYVHLTMYEPGFPDGKLNLIAQLGNLIRDPAPPEVEEWYTQWRSNRYVVSAQEKLGALPREGEGNYWNAGNHAAAIRDAAFESWTTTVRWSVAIKSAESAPLIVLAGLR